MNVSLNSQHDLSPRMGNIAAVLVLLSAAFIYLHGIAHFPPAPVNDGYLGLVDGLRISRGIPLAPIFLSDPEPAYRYLMGLWFVVAGAHLTTALFFQVCISLITVALTYRAGLLLLHRQPYGRLGALLAMGGVASLVPLIYYSRTTYRAILTPAIVLAALVMLLTAYRRRKHRQWLLAGFLGGCGVHAYLASTITPLWISGFLAHQLLVAPQKTRQRKLSWREAGLVGVGILPLLAIWLGLFLVIPDWFERVNRLGGGSLPDRVFAGFAGSVEGYYVRGASNWFDNGALAYAPLLNPVLAVLSVIGMLQALRKWHTAEAALLLGGLLVFTVPSALSGDPKRVGRITAVMPFLVLAAGWGGSWLLSRFSGLWHTFAGRRAGTMPGRLVPKLIVSMVVIASMLGGSSSFEKLVTDPALYQDPVNEKLSIPHLFSTTFIEAMQWLAQVDQPTYVPSWILDNWEANFALQSRVYTQVTTWARYGLKELPAGQFFFPTFSLYYTPLGPDEGGPRVLLLPQENTIVILPITGLPDSIAGPSARVGDPGTTEIKNKDGVIIARTRPVPRSAFSNPLTALPDRPVWGKGLTILPQLLSPEVQPGKTTDLVLYWVVTEPQPIDLFSAVQLINPVTLSAVKGGSDHYILPYLYPSARWRPGDIIPDVHTINIPADLPPGIYRWGAGVYYPPKKERVPISLNTNAGPQMPDLWLWDAVRLPKSQLSTQIPADAVSIDAQVGEDITLVGYQLVQDKATWNLVLYWRAVNQPPDDYTVFIHAEREGKLIAQIDQKPIPVPTWAWEPGEMIRTESSLALPADSPEPDALYAGTYSYPSLERLPVVQDRVARPDGRVLLWKK
jgi:hypothetical protein